MAFFEFHSDSQSLPISHFGHSRLLSVELLTESTQRIERCVLWPRWATFDVTMSILND